MIDKNKQYTTRSGLPVRIYATDCGDDYPVHGATCISGLWYVRSWAKDGSCVAGNECDLDLIEVKPRIKRTAWINVYASGEAAVHSSRECADEFASPRRIACIEIEIDCEEGEGL